MTASTFSKTVVSAPHLRGSETSAFALEGAAETTDTRRRETKLTAEKRMVEECRVG